VKAYITGIAGLLGSNLAARLLESGWSVCGCDDSTTSRISSAPNDAEVEIADIRRLTGLPKVDVVVHTAAIARSAWPDQKEMESVNVDGTLNVLQLARKINAKVVHCSSCVAAVPYINAYANSKLVGERHAVAMGATALRYSNIYGAGQSELGPEPNVLAAWRRQAREDGVIRVDGDGTQRRDFLHISDAVEATVRAALHAPQGRWIDVCSGAQTPIIELARRFDVPIRFAPRRENDPDVLPQTYAPAKKIFGFRAKVSLHEGLKEMLP
jgi:UDP-glucose 4-epimerase